MRKGLRAVLLAGLIALMAGLIAACGGGSSSSSEESTAGSETTASEESTSGEEEGSGEPYLVGHITTFNPAVAAPGEYYKGFAAYFKEVNAKGGVDGHEVEVETFDDELNPQKAVAGFNQMVENNAIAVTGLTISATVPPLSAGANRDEVPLVLGVSEASAATNPVTPWVFSFSEVFSDHLAVMAQFTVEKELGKKVALLYFEGPESELGNEFAEEYLPEIGLEVADVEYLSAEPDADFSKQVSAAKASGAEVIFVIHAPTGVIAVKKAMDAAGFNVPLLANPPGLNKTVFEVMGDTPYYAEATWAPNEEAEGWPELVAAAKKNGDSELAENQSSAYVGGWVGGILLTKALEGCGPDCTRATLRESLSELEASEAELGGLAAGFKIDEEHHLGPTAGWVFEEGKSGSLVPAAEKPFPYPENAG